MKNNKPKIIFFGSSDFSLPSLNALIREGFELPLVITRPPRPAGRALKVRQTPVQVLAEKNGLTVANSSDGVQIESLKPDLAVVVSYGRIIPKRILELFPFGALNVHPSLLPKYRGPSPLQSVLLSGEKTSGVTIIKLDDQMDHGPIVAQAVYKIKDQDNLSSLSGSLSALSAELLIKAIYEYVSGKIIPQDQDDAKATYCRMIEKEDGGINWSNPASQIICKIRSLNPWPGTFARLDFPSGLKIEAKITVANEDFSEELKPGEVLLGKDWLKIGCGENALNIKKLQLPGKKEMAIEDFLRGYGKKLSA